MYTEIRSLPDAELSALILAGAGGQQLGVTHAMGIGGSTSPAGNLVLARLLACANELLKRQAISTLSQRDCLDNMDHVGEYFVRHFRFHQRETFVVMFLDVQHRLICVEEMFRGTLTQTPVYPREVVKRALELNASSLILAHNHPSGECDASSADEHITAKLKSALALVDTKLLDHFIVAGDSYQSMAKADLL